MDLRSEPLSSRNETAAFACQVELIRSTQTSSNVRDVDEVRGATVLQDHRRHEAIGRETGNPGFAAFYSMHACTHRWGKERRNKNKNRGLGIPERDKRLRVDLLTGLSRGPIVACIFLLLLALLALCAKLADWYKVES